MNHIQLALWIAHPILQTVIAIAMRWRKLDRTFPVFFAYVISQTAGFCLLFPIRKFGTYPEYFYSYWVFQSISLGLGFKVIHEVFLDIFRPYHTLKDLGSVLFKWAGLVMLLVAVVVAAASPNGDQDPLVVSILTVERCVRVIQCGLVMFLLVFSKYVGVSRRQPSFGIALGFGSFALVELLMVALHASGHVTPAAISWANMVGYNFAILIWIGYTTLKSPARDSVANPMSLRWDQSLSDIQNPTAGESLIPMFESMVDRAFSRASGDADAVPARPVPGNSSRLSPSKPAKPLASHHAASKS